MDLDPGLRRMTGWGGGAACSTPTSWRAGATAPCTPGIRTTSPSGCTITRRRWAPGVAARYGVDKLVWFESHESRHAAFVRERQIKEWRRAWKLRLIEEANPDWRDLGEDLNNLLSF